MLSRRPRRDGKFAVADYLHLYVKCKCHRKISLECLDGIVRRLRQMDLDLRLIHDPKAMIAALRDNVHRDPHAAVRHASFFSPSAPSTKWPPTWSRQKSPHSASTEPSLHATVCGAKLGSPQQIAAQVLGQPPTREIPRGLAGPAACARSFLPTRASHGRSRVCTC